MEKNSHFVEFENVHCSKVLTVLPLRCIMVKYDINKDLIIFL